MNIKPNALFTGDNLYILNGMNSECVDLIYLDPPFNSKRMYKAPVGSKAAGAEFKDMWTWQDVDVETLERLVIDHPALVDYIQTIGAVHSKAMMSYITYMAQRLIQCHRVLKPTGSIYLHCDPTASHYLKIVLDVVFGRRNFRNELIWCYRGMPAKATKWQQKHDVILFYVKSRDAKFNVLLGEPTAGSRRTFESGRRRGYNANLSKKMVTVFDWDKYKKAVADGKIPSDLSPQQFKGGNPPMRDWWEDIKILGGPKNKERTDYPTQKPLALLERVIKASSNEGDVVLDPFCGCATAMVSAQQHRRKWIGIDIAEPAADVLLDRLSDDAGVLKDFAPKERLDFVHRTDIPQRSDITTINLKNPAQRKQTRDRLYGEQGGDCGGCHRHFEKQDFHLDHIIPKDKGGGDYIGNLQLLCGNCNSVKGNRPMEYLRGKIRARRERLAKVSFGE